MYMWSMGKNLIGCHGSSDPVFHSTAPSAPEAIHNLFSIPLGGSECFRSTLTSIDAMYLAVLREHSE